MKQIIFLLSSLFSCFVLYGQEQQLNCANNIAINQNVKNLKIFKYPDNFKAKKIIDFNNVLNYTPEDLISSAISATDLSWYNFNREEEKQKTTQNFTYIKQTNPEVYFAELLYKVSFIANGDEYAIVKYNLHDGNKPLLGYAEALKKKNGKWVITSEAEISQLFFFMIMIDSRYIDHIFNNEESDNSSLNQIVNSNQKNGIININAVLHDLEIELEKDSGNIKLILDPNRIFK